MKFKGYDIRLARLEKDHAHGRYAYFIGGIQRPDGSFMDGFSQDIESTRQAEVYQWAKEYILEDIKKRTSKSMKISERLNKLMFKEMAVVSKVKDTKTPQQKYDEAHKIFKQLISQTEGIDKSGLRFFDMRRKIQPIGNKAGVYFSGNFNFLSEYKGKDLGYYEIRNALQAQISKFRTQLKKIGKFTLPKSETKIELDTNYNLITTATVSVFGTIILSQIIAYLYDKNTNRKIKLGTYRSKFEAEDQAGGMYGFAINRPFREGEKYSIYYWGVNTNKQMTLKEFDTSEEARKYYDKVQISIEEIQK